MDVSLIMATPNIIFLILIVTYIQFINSAQYFDYIVIIINYNLSRSRLVLSLMQL